MNIDHILSTLTKSDLEKLASDSIGKFEEKIAGQIYDKLSENISMPSAKEEIIGIIITIIQRVLIPKAKEAILNRISINLPVEVSTPVFELEINERNQWSKNVK